MDLDEAKRIHRREVKRVGRGLSYRGDDSCRLRGEEPLPEAVKAVAVIRRERESGNPEAVSA